MKVRYTQDARRELRLIGDYLREQAPGAAKRVVAAIRARVAQLETHPHLGKPTSESGIRSLSINRYPYTAYYRVEDDAVSIVHIRHQRRAPWQGPR
jgi:addiction module RelE/StbE family toxin